MESRQEQWTRESEEHTTTINTQKLINLEKALANAKTSAEFFKSSLEETNAINERLSESNKRLETALAAAQERIAKLSDENEFMENQLDIAATKHLKNLTVLAADQERERVLRESVDGLLDGLDANYDGRCGLSAATWDKRIKQARAALEGKEG